MKRKNTPRLIVAWVFGLSLLVGCGIAVLPFEIGCWDPTTCTNGWDGPGLGGATIDWYLGDPNKPNNGLPTGFTLAQVETELRAAMATWSSVADITFNKVGDYTDGPPPFNPGTIYIYWAAGDHGCGFPFDGPWNPSTGVGYVLAHAWGPLDISGYEGNIHLDADETWVTSGEVIGTTSATIDIQTVLLHELGHSLGLAHEDDLGSGLTAPVMQSLHWGELRTLHQDDINGIQSLYGRERMCWPPHRGVPIDPDPPDIDGSVQEDVGWRGTQRHVYGNGTDTAHMALQTLHHRTDDYLYVSLEVRNDPSFDNTDVVVLSFRPNAASTVAANDVRLVIYPLCDNDGAAGSSCTLTTPSDKLDRAPRVLEVWKNSASWTQMATLPTNLDVKVRSYPDGSSYSWNVEVKVPTSVTAGGAQWVNFTDDFLFYANVIRVSGPSGTASEFRWPRKALKVSGPISSYPFNPAEWGNGTKSSTATCKGVSITYSDIGTTNTPSSTIVVNPVPNTFSNTFYATVRNDTEVSGTSQQASDVRVRFRIANWGISGPRDWEDIPVANPGCPDATLASNPTCPQDIPAAAGGVPGSTTFNLKWTVPDADVPQYQTNRHQCILVELDSLSDANIVTKSVYRNMDFVSASEFVRSAEISARGYGEPPAGLSEHQFTLHVTTQNQTKIPRKQEKAVIDEEEQLSRMTWIAHGYRRSGGFIVIQGHRYALVDSVGSFGYVVQHSGKVKEWKHELIDAEKIGPNLYKLLIRPDDVAVVTTRIESKEYEKKWSVGIHSGAAVPRGSFNKNFDPGLNVLLGTYYQISPQFSLAAFFGYNDFKSKTAGVEDTYWINLSANMKYRLRPGALSPYFSGGLGYYIPKTGNSGFGINLGVGLDYDYNNFITLELGADYHAIFYKDAQFLHSHAGVIFRF